MDPHDSRDVQSRANELVATLDICRHSSAELRSRCTDCKLDAEHAAYITDRKARNVGHECEGCSGGGYVEGFMSFSPCAACGSSGRRREAERLTLDDWFTAQENDNEDAA